MNDFLVRKAGRKIGQQLRTTEQIMTTPIWDLFQPEKSIDMLLSAAEEIKEDYRVSLNLRYINELIYFHCFHFSALNQSLISNKLQKGFDFLLTSFGILIHKCKPSVN